MAPRHTALMCPAPSLSAPSKISGLPEQNQGDAPDAVERLRHEDEYRCGTIGGIVQPMVGLNKAGLNKAGLGRAGLGWAGEAYMPFVDPQAKPVPGPIGRLPDPAPQGPAPSFWSETVPAAWRTENTIGSAMAMGADVPLMYRRDAINPDFDPFKGLEDTQYATHLDRFAFANSHEDVLAVKRQLDREIEDRKTLDRAGWSGMAAMFAVGAVDPVNLIPVGGQAARIAKTGGSILKAGLATARAGLVSSTAAELVLQQTQLTRTPTEGVANIAVATFLSGVLGSSVGQVRKMAEARALGNMHDRVKMPNADGTLGGDGVVKIAMGDLEEGLSKVDFDEGGGVLRENGSVNLAKKRGGKNYGMVKVVWKHGVKSAKTENPGAYVTRDDLTAFPSIARQFEGAKAHDPDKGLMRWQWVVERRGANGDVRPVLYSVRRFMHGDNKDHVVTVHVLDKGEAERLSQPRSKFWQTKNDGTGSSSEGLGLLRDTAEGSLYRHNRGQSSPPTKSIAERDPFASQADAWADQPDTHVASYPGDQGSNGTIPPKALNINLSRIDTTSDVKRAMVETSNALRETMDEATRGRVSNAETQKLAARCKRSRLSPRARKNVTARLWSCCSPVTGMTSAATWRKN